MKHVAVLGGGPAGAFAAERLASAGIRTTLLDEKLAWEKPCGGGVTHKAYQRYPFLFQSEVAKQPVRSAAMGAPHAGDVEFELSHPLVIYSRRELNGLLLDRARAAGAVVEKARVLSAERNGSWHIRTSQGDFGADYCIAATGARNPLRNLGTELQPGHTMMALGYYLPGSYPRVEIHFLSGLDGYVWIFPRHDHVSVGIGGKGESSASMRARLEEWLRAKGLSFEGARFYAHIIPSLPSTAWKSNRVAGEGWMAAGDAGGFVDPLTGEGIYFALRSAEIATDLILADRQEPAELPAAYRRALAEDFGDDLAYGANLGERLGKHISAAAAVSVQWMKRSAKFTDIMQDLISGSQPYLGLKSRLIRDLAPAGLGPLFRSGSMSLRLVGRALGHLS